VIERGGMATQHPAWRWFAAWCFVGALYSGGLLTILSIGIIVGPIAIGCTLLLARRPSSARGLPGLIAGASVPLLYVALLTRRGPGLVCSRIPGGVTCSQEYNPWVWMSAGVLLIAAGLLAMVTTHRATAIRERPNSE
jgi:uncharacterized membrane protein YczE